MMEEATVTKIIVTFLLWSIKFACGVAPLLFRGRLRAPNRGWWTKKLIGNANAVRPDYEDNFSLTVN